MKIIGKRVICLLAAVLLLVSMLPRLTAGASDAVIAEGSCGEKVTWQLDSLGTLIISGTGKMYNYTYVYHGYDVPLDEYPAPWYEYRQLIKRVVILNGVTSIGEAAFLECENMTHAVIPESVTSFGAFMFEECESLTTVNIPGQIKKIPNYAFYFCGSLTSVTLPNGLESIGRCAFGHCKSLTAITIPESVTSMGDSVFQRCKNLSCVTFCGSAPSFESTSFSEVETTVFYPCNDETWAGKTEDYAGTLTWTMKHSGDVDVVNQDATCEQDAAIIQTCLNCGFANTTYISGTATGHQFVNGVCTLCNQADLPAGGTCGENLQWQLDTLGTLTISGIGPMDGYDVPDGSDVPDTPWYAYRQSITNIVIEEGVTAIGKLAFYNCTNVTDVTIAKSVTTIGSAAFRSCTGLSGLIIPEGVTQIGKIAFYDCSGLKSVTVPDSVIDIGAHAFYQCTSLTDITFYGAAPAMDSTCFRGVIATATYPCGEAGWANAVNQSYGGNLTWNAEHSYVNGVCTRCRDAQILDSGACGINLQWVLDSLGTLTISGSGAMYDYSMETGGCDYDPWGYNPAPWYEHRDRLKKVVLLDGVTTIGKYAFNECSNMTMVTMPDSITTIGRYAFTRCSSLTAVTIPKNVKKIDYSTFERCTSLASVTIPQGVTVIDQIAFCGCTSLTSITIPDSVTTIGRHTFTDCSGLTSITIPKSVKTLELSAFCRCTGLKTIEFLGKAPEIDSSCFLKVTATAYYPCGETSWSSRKRNYGGTITWEAKHSVYVDHFIQDATCEQDAAITKTCLDCGATDTTYIPGTATGHSYQEAVWITEWSCTVDGKQSQTCSACGDIKYVTFPATGHDYRITVVPVTCTDYGYELHACQNCGDSFYCQVEAPTGHKYVDGKCECGAVLVQGDITGDGKLNMGDVAKLYAAVRGKTQLDETVSADLTGDGKLNMGDVAKLAVMIKAGQ